MTSHQFVKESTIANQMAEQGSHYKKETPDTRHSVNESAQVPDTRHSVNESAQVPDTLHSVDESAQVPDTRHSVDESAQVPDTRHSVDESATVAVNKDASPGMKQNIDQQRPLKKDGTPNMRYSVNRNVDAQRPLNEDRTPDMRYRVNRNTRSARWGAPAPANATGSAHNVNNTTVPVKDLTPDMHFTTFSNVLVPLKKDGTPDLRFAIFRNSGVPLKKDGTPDMRFAGNSKAPGPFTMKAPGAWSDWQQHRSVAPDIGPSKSRRSADPCQPPTDAHLSHYFNRNAPQTAWVLNSFSTSSTPATNSHCMSINSTPATVVAEGPDPGSPTLFPTPSQSEWGDESNRDDIDINVLELSAAIANQQDEEIFWRRKTIEKLKVPIEMVQVLDHVPRDEAGSVFNAIYHGSLVSVKVKKCDETQQKDLLDEAVVGLHGDQKIVSMLYWSIQTAPERNLLLIMPLLPSNLCDVARSLPQANGCWGVFGKVQLLAIALDIASALDCLARKNFVHQNVNPQNLFLRDKPGVPAECHIDPNANTIEQKVLLRLNGVKFEALLMGFGLAAATLEEDAERYVSPEGRQLRTNRLTPITQASDVYSLGAILSELLPQSTDSGDNDLLEFQSLLKKMIVEDAFSRPTAKEVVSTISAMLGG